MNTWPNREGLRRPLRGGCERESLNPRAVRPRRPDSSQQASSKPGAVQTVCTELFLQGLGCVGVAAGILTESLKAAIWTNEVLTMELLRQNYYPAAALEKMRGELEKGMVNVDAVLSPSSLLPSAGAPPSPSAECSTSELMPGDTKPARLATGG